MNKVIFEGVIPGEEAFADGIRAGFQYAERMALREGLADFASKLRERHEAENIIPPEERAPGSRYRDLTSPRSDRA